MPTVKVTISEDSYTFADEHSLDLDTLLETAISDKQAAHQYQNPTPEIPESTLSKLDSVLTDAQNGDEVTAFSDEVLGRISISAVHRNEDKVVDINLYSRSAGTLPVGEVGPTLEESGEFLVELGKQLRTQVSNSLDVKSETITFERTENDSAEHELDQHTIRYVTQVSL